MAERVSIIIAGMGPVGMTAALALGRLGHVVTVLEKGDDLAAESRASTFHPSSLEILDELGVAEELIDTGLRADAFQYRGGDRELIAHLDMGLLAGDTRFPFRIQNEQANLTRIIRRRLATIPNVTLRFSAPVDRVEVSESLAYVYLPGDGLNPSYAADWLIAADGANSAVRRSLGIAFDGITYPERFLVASTTHDFQEDFDNLSFVSYVHDPEDWGVLLRTPRHWRVLFPILAEESDVAALDPARVQQRLQGVVALDKPYEIVHSTIYKVHQRVAARFAQGRALLAGDAAHINNPLGGLGMNSGIHDAHAAVMAIDSALAGNDPRRVADIYTRVRRDAAMNDVQSQTHKNYEEMRSRDHAAREERRQQMAALSRDPVKARAYLRNTSMLASFETSRRRMQRGLYPHRAAAALPAGLALSDKLTEALLDRPPTKIWQLPAPVSSNDDIAKLVAAAERNDIGALVIDSAKAASVAELHVRAAHAARRDLLVFATVEANDKGVEAARHLAAAGADAIAVEGFPGAGLVEKLHAAVPGVPVVLIEPGADLPNATELVLMGVNLILARPSLPSMPISERFSVHDNAVVA
jgi:2-polyprenyl-6-methoxyphenol hydroxylase-like FAD-dependent oxidoreductase